MYVNEDSEVNKYKNLVGKRRAEFLAKMDKIKDKEVQTAMLFLMGWVESKIDVVDKKIDKLVDSLCHVLAEDQR